MSILNLNIFSLALTDSLVYYIIYVKCPKLKVKKSHLPTLFCIFHLLFFIGTILFFLASKCKMVKRKAITSRRLKYLNNIKLVECYTAEFPSLYTYKSLLLHSYLAFINYQGIKRTIFWK